MTLEEMQKKKREQGFTNEMLAEKSGIPLSTVQKVMSGHTRAPRRKTIRALEYVLADGYVVPEPAAGTGENLAEQMHVFENIDAFALRSGKPYDEAYRCVRESAPAYGAALSRKFTVDDIEDLPESMRAELIDGKIYYMAPPTRMHQEIISELHYQVQYYIRSHGGDCKVYESPIGVYLDADKYTVVEPDLVVICDRDKLTEKGCTGAPDWVVEVLSPSTKYKDLVTKLHKYQNAGVKEYWIIHPEKRQIQVYVFGEDGEAEIYSFEDEIRVSLYPDLSIRLGDYL